MFYLMCFDSLWQIPTIISLGFVISPFAVTINCLVETFMTMSQEAQATITEKPKGFSVYLYGALFGFLKLIGRLPYPVLKFLGKSLGKLLYLVKSRRNIVLANLAYCFPEKSESERLATCKAHFEHLGIGFIELAVAWHRPFEELKDIHEIHGLEHYHKAQETGQGIILLGHHTASMELAGALMSKYLDFAAFYRPNNDKALNYYIQKGRDNRTPSLGRNDVRAIAKWLKQGNNLWFSPDQDMGSKNTLFAPFFNKQIATANSPIRIARLGNAKVLPIHYYKKSGKMIIEILPELIFSGDELADCTLMNQIVEEVVLKAPEQYYWVHRRFKTLPEGQASIYR